MADGGTGMPAGPVGIPPVGMPPVGMPLVMCPPGALPRRDLGGTWVPGLPVRNGCTHTLRGYPAVRAAGRGRAGTGPAGCGAAEAARRRRQNLRVDGDVERGGRVLDVDEVVALDEVVERHRADGRPAACVPIERATTVDAP